MTNTRIVPALIAFFSSILLSFSAQAFVQPAGTFIPYQCGEQTLPVANPQAPGITVVCIGMVVGSKVQSVQFRMADKSAHTFQISSRQDLFNSLMSGNRMAVYQLVDDKGVTTAMKAIVTREGSIKSLSGDYETNSFLVPDLHVMMVPM